MNNEIKLTDIQVTGEEENTFNTEIMNTEEALIEAHNASSEAHINTFNDINKRIEDIKTVHDNIVVKSDVPQKLSDLQNDLKFVSEETLINAIELRQLTNQKTVEDLIEQAQSVTQNDLTANVNTINTKLSNIKSDMQELTSPTRITNLASPSDYTPIDLSVTLPFTTLIAPADGFLSVFLKGTRNGAFVWVHRGADASKFGMNLLQEYYTGFEMRVHKDEQILFQGDGLADIHVKFHYLIGSAPEPTQ